LHFIALIAKSILSLQGSKIISSSCSIISS
jgi:hypothetical protein